MRRVTRIVTCIVTCAVLFAVAAPASAESVEALIPGRVGYDEVFPQVTFWLKAVGHGDTEALIAAAPPAAQPRVREMLARHDPHLAYLTDLGSPWPPMARSIATVTALYKRILPDGRLSGVTACFFDGTRRKAGTAKEYDAIYADAGKNGVRCQRFQKVEGRWYVQYPSELDDVLP